LIQIMPKVDRDDLFVRLFHKAVASQWSSDDVDWEAPLGLEPRQAVALTRVLTPVYLGEQTAMLGASATLPQLSAAGETSAQLYLSTFLLDEARHFEALTQLYQRLGHNPVSIREVPEMLRYHHRLRQGDRIDWLWGILISDLFARQFYYGFAKVQPGALFGQMSAKILVDESRHQAFAHTYLKNALPGLPPERRRALREMQSDLLKTMEAIHDRLRDDTEALGLDGHAFIGELIAQIEAHSRSIGLFDDESGGGGTGSGDHAAWARLIERKREVSLRSGGLIWPRTDAAALPSEPARQGPRQGRSRYHYFDLRGLAAECGQCFIALLCRSRAVRAGCTA
jgi:hypothetical protein